MPNELKVFFLELWDGAQELLLRNVTQAKRARFELDRLESGKRLIIKIYSANKKGKYAGGGYLGIKESDNTLFKNLEFGGEIFFSFNYFTLFDLASCSLPWPT